MRGGVIGILTLASAAPALAFTPSWVSALSGRGERLSNASGGPGTSFRTPLDAVASDEVPILEEWRLLRNGAIVGTVSNHAIIDDGDVITTSPLEDPSVCEAGAVVTTMSGSNYRLGLKYAPKKQRGGLFSMDDVVSKAKKKVEEQFTDNYVSAPTTKVPSANGNSDLTGLTVGDGKYLLVGESQRSTSGKSQIFAAYRADRNGQPTGNTLTIKISSNCEAMERECRNYDLVTAGLFQGLFMNKVEFIPDAGPDFRKFCALVIETGKVDLKGLLASRENTGLEGKAMRNAAYRAAKTIQAMHSVSLVWTDLKAENFVLMPDSVDMAGMVAIDLESAIPHGEYPVDYSPEACPPEFAKAFVAGEADEFVLDYSYDIWSYGMLMYELSTGEPYFAGKSPAEITKALNDEDFRADPRAVESPQLRGLIRMCLQNDPEKRPSIFQILLHPYFLTSGFGRISF